MAQFEFRASGGTFTIDRCDLTIWNLQSVIGTQRFVVDLLLEVTAIEVLAKIKVAVPFEIDAWEDLSELPAEQLPTWLRGTTADRSRVCLTSITCEGARKIPSILVRRHRVVTTADIELESGPQSGVARVILLRFHANHVSFALWKRSFLGINGVIIDSAITTQSPATGTVIPSQRAFHIVLRASLQPKTMFPPMQPGLVEQSDWNPYLGRVPDLRREGALVVLSHHATHSVDERVYVDASREFGLLPFGNFFRIFLLTLFSIYLMAWVRDKTWTGPGSPSAGDIGSFFGNIFRVHDAQAGFLWFRTSGWIAAVIILCLLMRKAKGLRRRLRHLERRFLARGYQRKS